jgi:hypothetical protein
MFGLAGIDCLALKGDCGAGSKIPLAHFDLGDLKFHDSIKSDELRNVKKKFKLFWNCFNNIGIVLKKHSHHLFTFRCESICLSNF